MDHIEATIRQLDGPSVGSGHVSEMGQLGYRHCNSGICPEVRIQRRHCHAGSGFAVRLTKEIEDLARRFAELHWTSPLSRVSSDQLALYLYEHVLAGHLMACINHQSPHPLQLDIDPARSRCA
jgi:hypothetical protein